MNNEHGLAIQKKVYWNLSKEKTIKQLNYTKVLNYNKSCDNVTR